MKIKDLKEKIIGKKLLSVIQLNPVNEIDNIIRQVTGDNGDSSIEEVQLLVFEDGVELIYTDYDGDGYRSGSWYLSILNDVLDKGNTKEIKNINSIVRDIIYMEDKDGDEKHYFLLTTDEYIITFGQNNVCDYYPSNFFSIEECKEKAISDRKVIKGENIEGS